MKIVKFPQSNRTLGPPSGGEDWCERLPIWTDGEDCVSCWRFSFIERVRILLFGRAWLWVRSGSTQPPVSLQVENPFPGPAPEFVEPYFER